MLKKNGMKIIAILVMLSMVLAFTGCAKETTSADPQKPEAQKAAEEKASTKLDKIKESGKLVLGTSADYPPYEFHRVADGKDEIVGFDIDIAKAIADDLGVKLEIKDMKFDGLLAALQAGNIDFIVAGMVPTEERKKSVDFSKTYYQAEQKMVIRTEDADKLKTIDDLAGLKIGAQKSTVQETIANEQIVDAQVKSLAKIPDLVLELKNKKIDGVILVAPVADAFAKKNSDVVVPEISFGKEDGVAIAIKKGNEDFVEAINATLDKLMAEDGINKFISEATMLADQE